MAQLRSYTTIEQSKKLAEILPIDSADMLHCIDFDGDWLFTVLKQYSGSFKYQTEITIPCWSLSALLDILPDEITDDGDVYRNMFFHLKGKYIIQYPRLTTLWPSLLSVEAYNPVDACYEMILLLHDKNLI